MKITLIAVLAATATVCSAADRAWKSERSDYRDEVTGTEVWRRTTDPEVEIIPDRIKDPWSPDGSQILFRSKRTGAWHLFVMTADGSKITRVTDQRGPTVYGVWSRSGREVVCTPLVNNKYELHEINLKTCASRRIAGPFESQLNKMGVSPDGESVLFTRVIKQPGGDKQDVVMSSFVKMDGTGFFDFTGETKHGRIGWIPGRMDIRRMKSSRQQYVVQPDGSGARLIGEGGHEYFTPDGQNMLICDPKGGDPAKWLGECSAGLYNLETGVRRDVTKELTWLGSHPAISPDGRYVAADNAGHSYPGAIVIVPIDGSSPALRVLCYHHASWESGHITHPTVHWSPDGTKLLFISDKDSPDKKKGDMYLAVAKQPEAPRQPHVADNRADGPLLTWQPARRHGETKEYVIMRSVPSPRPNLRGVKLDCTGVFEKVGVVPVVDIILTGKYLDAKAATLIVESTEGFPNSGQLLIAGNHSMAEPEVVTYTGKTETTFLKCQRGGESSEPAMHWSGARVWSLSAMRFTDTKLPDPERQYYYTVRAREHSGLTSPYSRISNPAVITDNK
ncbi:MAG: PD40 domain-containing protein [Planctomycetes bacterium]|nr:PD40 domain-containing protein [Planctomycetota bacterium]